MSRTQYAQMAQEKMKESNLWFESARVDLRIAFDSALLAQGFHCLANKAGVPESERQRLVMAAVRFQAEAAGRLRQIPSLVKTGRALRLAAIELDERANDREWAEMQRETDEPKSIEYKTLGR